jgi:hypothetical protein
MIRPLRRRHLWLIALAGLTLVVAAWIAHAHPVVAGDVDRLPSAVDSRP